MKFGDFMAALKKGPPKNVYLLAGEEYYFIEKARERLLGVLFPHGGRDKSLQTADGAASLDDIIGMASDLPLFAEKNVLLVKNATYFKESKKAAEGDAGDEKGGADKSVGRFVKFLAEMPPTSCIIFELAAKADKRRKLYKAIEKCGATLEADAVRAWNVNEFLQEKLQSLNREMEPSATAYFLIAVAMMQPVSLAFLDKEFDKLALFAKERRITKAELTAAFSAVPEISNFALIDAVTQKKARVALSLLSRQAANGEYMPPLLALIARHVRQLLLIKAALKRGAAVREIAAKMGLVPGIAEKLVRCSANFSEATLKKAVLCLADADYKIKTGRGGIELVFYVVVMLCRKENQKNP